MERQGELRKKTTHIFVESWARVDDKYGGPWIQNMAAKHGFKVVSCEWICECLYKDVQVYEEDYDLLLTLKEIATCKWQWEEVENYPQGSIYWHWEFKKLANRRAQCKTVQRDLPGSPLKNLGTMLFRQKMWVLYNGCDVYNI